MTETSGEERAQNSCSHAWASGDAVPGWGAGWTRGQPSDSGGPTVLARKSPTGSAEPALMGREVNRAPVPSGHRFTSCLGHSRSALAPNVVTCWLLAAQGAAKCKFCFEIPAALCPVPRQGLRLRGGRQVMSGTAGLHQQHLWVACDLGWLPVSKPPFPPL